MYKVCSMLQVLNRLSIPCVLISLSKDMTKKSRMASFQLLRITLLSYVLFKWYLTCCAISESIQKLQLNFPSNGIKHCLYIRSQYRSKLSLRNHIFMKSGVTQTQHELNSIFSLTMLLINIYIYKQLRICKYICPQSPLLFSINYKSQ